VTINLFAQEDRSPSRTGRAQFQTHATNNARLTETYKPPTTRRWTPNELAPTHPHWQIWRGSRRYEDAVRDLYQSR
jgi:hypothetical protein